MVILIHTIMAVTEFKHKNLVSLAKTKFRAFLTSSSIPNSFLCISFYGFHPTPPFPKKEVIHSERLLTALQLSFGSCSCQYQTELWKLPLLTCMSKSSACTSHLSRNYFTLSSGSYLEIEIQAISYSEGLWWYTSSLRTKGIFFGRLGNPMPAPIYQRSRNDPVFLNYVTRRRRQGLQNH